MNFTDFMYDDMYLSDFGCIVCTFDSNNGVENITGSEISFNTVSVQNGKRHLLVSSAYNSRLEAEFQICKNPELAETQDDMYFTIMEENQIRRWLNRMDLSKFRILDDDGEYYGFYFEGSFNIEAIKHVDRVAGFNLKFVSNKPFAIGNDKVLKFTISQADGEYSIIDTSDEIGYLYLDAEIKCKSDGTLRITNNRNHKTTEIKNCVYDEVIYIKDMLIETSNSSHSSILDDFNYVFPTIMNDLRDRKNVFSFSLPCEVIFKYKPIRKVGIL